MIKKIKKNKLIWLYPPFAMHVPCTNYNDFNLKKKQTILIPIKYNYKFTNEINLLPSRRFSNFNFFFLLKMKKNRLLWFKLSQIYGSMFRVFWGVLPKNTNCKKFLPPWGYLPPYVESIAPIYTKIIYDLTIAAINKYFEFQSDWLKIIRIRYNCTQFCLIPLY